MIDERDNTGKDRRTATRSGDALDLKGYIEVTLKSRQGRDRVMKGRAAPYTSRASGDDLDVLPESRYVRVGTS